MTGCFDASVVPPVLAASTRRVRELADLACIFEPEVQVACLARDAQPAIERELEHAVATGALGSGFSGTHAVEEPRNAMVIPGGVGSALRADIAALIELYADLVGCPVVGLRMEVLKRAMCPRLHVDRVALRLLVTYRGPGTEWVDDAAAARPDRDVDAIEPPVASAEDRPNRLASEQARPFDVVLLKGSLWPGNQARGAIHRSPPLCANEGPRVLVALDALWA